MGEEPRLRLLGRPRHLVDGGPVVGLQVLEALKALDDVGFVRYASVYRDFSHVDDFEKILSEVAAKIARDPGADG